MKKDYQKRPMSYQPKKNERVSKRKPPHKAYSIFTVNQLGFKFDFWYRKLELFLNRRPTVSPSAPLLEARSWWPTRRHTSATSEIDDSWYVNIHTIQERTWTHNSHVDRTLCVLWPSDDANQESWSNRVHCCPVLPCHTTYSTYRRWRQPSQSTRKFQLTLTVVSWTNSCHADRLPHRCQPI